MIKLSPYQVSRAISAAIEYISLWVYVHVTSRKFKEREQNLQVFNASRIEACLLVLYKPDLIIF